MASAPRSLRTTLRGAQDADNSGSESGGKRKKLAGYLKAANELRQSYQQSYSQSWATRDGQDDEPVPGGFPGGATARSGDDEMIVFPSYARRHVKQKPTAVPGTIQEASGEGRDSRDSIGAGDAEYWKQEWDKYEDDNAIVDVDVRGWIFSPHKGPLNRSNRLFIGVARRMVGIPAPSGASPDATKNNSRASSPHGIRERLDAKSAQHEAELVTLEAQALLERGEAEAAAAREGKYSELLPGERSRQNSRSDSPTKDSDRESRKDFTNPSRSRPLSTYDSSGITPLQKRASWNHPAQMTAAELALANTNLMSRLEPFLANPLMNTPISAFFYNDKISRQKTFETNAAGHFTVRASLDFIPTHVRILASEHLSATEEIMVTEPNGVTVISDIDDTIKHSAISGGAREIFRNVFIRDLSDLTIDGVTEWYRRMESMDVKFHYVSNSPWQLFPVLLKYFSAADLPAGSFHLKQYSGVLAGIFEPVAERKKGTLEKIMRDFPDRKYILVGDSGEADLEVYTDVVLENPGRVLGVFIRDVTTPPAKKGFFDSSMGPLAGSRSSSPKSSSRLTLNGHKRQASQLRDEDDVGLKAAIAASLAEGDTRGRQDTSDSKEARPHLPPRARTDAPPTEEDLIDLNWDDTQPARPSWANASEAILASDPKPSEPAVKRKQPPPRPRKPSTSVKPCVPPKPTPTEDASKTASNPEDQKTSTTKPPRPAPPPTRETYGYGTSARQKLSSAYNALPSLHAHSNNNTTSQPTSSSAPQRPSSIRSATTQSTSSSIHDSNIPPPIPTRKPLSSYPAAAAHSISNLYNSDNGSGGAGGGGMSQNGGGPAAVVNKKEELWNRRWARAKGIMEDHGVMLRSWRFGGDVVDDAVGLVEGWTRELEGREKGKGKM